MNERPLPTRLGEVRPHPEAPTLSPAPHLRAGARILTGMAKRAASTSRLDVLAYTPTPLVEGLLEAFSSGVLRLEDQAELLQTTKPALQALLRDPVVCGWLMTQLHDTIAERLKVVDAAMYARAVGGDVAAARLIYDRYEPIVQTHRHLVGPDTELRAMSDEELMRLASTKLIEVTDVQPEPESESESGASDA